MWVNPYIIIHENGEIAFLRGIYNVVVNGFDIDVSRRTGQGWKSADAILDPHLACLFLNTQRSILPSSSIIMPRLPPQLLKY